MDYANDNEDLREIYTVSGLNQAVREWLEEGFALVWVEGELSNLARPTSGHWYFSLKDDTAQVRCAMFRGRNRMVSFTPENGAQVLILARVGLYEARGEYQLVVDDMEPAGDGALRRAYEALKKKLAGEGLFDADLKRPLPVLPKQIGVVTSPTGAAIRDILAVTGRRFPGIPILIYPVPVQGERAAAEIARMVGIAGARAECDVLILARGGGSLEDLWCFNDEALARTIRACPIPVVTGIGHEVDVTIADLAADLHAPTPSAAAERVTPDGRQWLDGLARQHRQLIRAVERRLDHYAQRLDWVERRLQQRHPGRRLQLAEQGLADLDRRLHRAVQTLLLRNTTRLREVEARFMRHEPSRRIQHAEMLRRQYRERLEQIMLRRLERRRQTLAGLCRALDAVSPLATLARGYGIVRDGDGHVIKAVTDACVGQGVEVRLRDGRLACTVDRIEITGEGS
ncbi:MAG: exodeoxyribonuclease VII large subunit [Gammaproteobacteria bacterium]|nr:exodeoxyribonuclease VII large subunit [Gammaproteobacteria bacterium]